MLTEKRQYWIINAVFLAALAYVLFAVISLFLGGGVSHKRMMNALVLGAYGVCLIGFNGGDAAKHNSSFRNIGMGLTIVFLVLTLLTFSDIIPFRYSWNFMLAGLSLSFLMSVLFQVYRVDILKKGWQWLLKRSLYILSAAVFTMLFVIYMMRLSSKWIYDAMFYLLLVYSIVAILFYSYAGMRKTKQE